MGMGNDLIKRMMDDNDTLARALVVLKNRQTQDEQAVQRTRHENGRGFRPNHAPMGTSMAQFYERTGYLTAKQANWWRVRGKEGPRIAIYWRQLVSEYNQVMGG